MTSKLLQVVNDTPGSFASAHGNSLYDMPTGSTTGEDSHWLPNIYDVLNDNVNVQLKSLTDGSVIDTTIPESGFTNFRNVDKLFSSYNPNNDSNTDLSFYAEFNQSSKGKKFLVLGSPYKSQLLNQKARWTTSIGVQMSLATHCDMNSLMFQRISLIYYKPGDEGLYYSRVTACDCHTVENTYQRFYGYVSDEEATLILTQKLITIGAVLEFDTRGSGYVNIFDFKLLRSRRGKSKKSLLVLPAPHLIKDRQRLQSVPIA